MAIELSNLIFTEQDDIVPEAGQYGPIFNTYTANTLAGNDSITGSIYDDELYYDPENYSGFINWGELNTDDGNDIITGSVLYARHSGRPGGYNMINFGTLNTGEGDDMIDGSNQNGGYFPSYRGIKNSGTLSAGEGDDTITAVGIGLEGFENYGTLNMEDGNDIITAFSEYHFSYNSSGIGFLNGEGSALDMGEGNDTIIGGSSFNSYIPSSAISNWPSSTLNTGNGEDFILSEGWFINGGYVFLGEGNDSLTSTNFNERALENNNFIGTGDGDDIITSNGAIYNEGVIETGNGNDSIIVNGGGFDNITGTTYYGIDNNGGAVNTGNGNDSIIADAGFKSGPNSSGAWFLGEGEDYIKGFGSGDFYGGNGNDTLELTPGTYTVGIWGEAGESPIFTRGDQLMITSEFEKLKVGSTIYDFTSLIAGQIITVAEV
jgi:hypothetical protein